MVLHRDIPVDLTASPDASDPATSPPPGAEEESSGEEEDKEEEEESGSEDDDDDEDYPAAAPPAKKQQRQQGAQVAAAAAAGAKRPLADQARTPQPAKKARGEQQQQKAPATAPAKVAGAKDGAKEGKEARAPPAGMATPGTDKEYLEALKAALKAGPLKLATVRRGGGALWSGWKAYWGSYGERRAAVGGRQGTQGTRLLLPLLGPLGLLLPGCPYMPAELYWRPTRSPPAARHQGEAAAQRAQAEALHRPPPWRLQVGWLGGLGGCWLGGCCSCH